MPSPEVTEPSLCAVAAGAAEAGCITPPRWRPLVAVVSSRGRNQFTQAHPEGNGTRLVDILAVNDNTNDLPDTRSTCTTASTTRKNFLMGWVEGEEKVSRRATTTRHNEKREGERERKEKEREVESVGNALHSILLVALLLAAP